jgi:Sec-independent protein secretion pathway component TatC
MAMLAVPLYGLYELGLILLRAFPPGGTRKTTAPPETTSKTTPEPDGDAEDDTTRDPTRDTD